MKNKCIDCETVKKCYACEQEYYFNDNKCYDCSGANENVIHVKIISK